MSRTNFNIEIEALRTILDALDPLDEQQRQFVVRSAIDRLNIKPSNPLLPEDPHKAPTNIGLTQTNSNGPSPKEFLGQKNPSTVVERLTCLGYYLTHYRQKAHFKASDLTKLNTEAAGQKISNVSIFARNAVSQNNYFAPAGEGKKQITAHGEAVVMALPDRLKVKELVENCKTKKH